MNIPALGQDLAIYGVAFVFITVGLTNRARNKGPWRALLCGGLALAVMETLSLLGLVKL